MQPPAPPHHSPRHRFARRLGYRGRALLLLGAVWFVIGFTLLDWTDPDPLHTTPLEWLPLWARIGIWWAAAGIAWTTAWWPPGRTTWGFIALVIPVAFRAASYGTAALIGWYTEPVDVAIAWACVTAFVMLCADWPEPPTIPTSTTGGDQNRASQ